MISTNRMHGNQCQVWSYTRVHTVRGRHFWATYIMVGGIQDRIL